MKHDTMADKALELVLNDPDIDRYITQVAIELWGFDQEYCTVLHNLEGEGVFDEGSTKLNADAKKVCIRHYDLYYLARTQAVQTLLTYMMYHNRPFLRKFEQERVELPVAVQEAIEVYADGLRDQLNDTGASFMERGHAAESLHEIERWQERQK